MGCCERKEGGREGGREGVVKIVRMCVCGKGKGKERMRVRELIYQSKAPFAESNKSRQCQENRERKRVFACVLVSCLSSLFLPLFLAVRQGGNGGGATMHRKHGCYTGGDRR